MSSQSQKHALNVDPKISSLGFPEPKKTPKQRTTGNYCYDCELCGGGGSLVIGVGSVCGDWGGVSTDGRFQRIYADLTPNT